MGGTGTAKTPNASTGLREQHKREKQQRIREAARELFAERGYDAATMRQIAKRARVGLGTLFAYAEDKRDLIFLIVNEELSAILEEAIRTAPSSPAFVDSLIALYEPHYRYFSKNPELSRILLRELVFYSEGKQAAMFQRTRASFLAAIANLVHNAQQDGRIRTQEDPDILARYIFFLTSGAIRLWIAAPRPKPGPGLAELRHVLEVFVNGLGPASPSDAAPRLSHARRLGN
jgi:AcrR family transcriptional regulator